MKRVIVFGASGGIGQEICRSLAADGWSIYVHYRKNVEIAQKLVTELLEKYPNQDFFTIKLDFASSDQQLEDFVKSLFPVNAVVFAQGITKYGFLSEQSLTDIDQVMKINLTVPIKLTKLLEPMLVKHEMSRIVYLGSVYGGQGSALETIYSATKAGLSRFSQAYAREVASTGLTVNTIAPGAVATEMNKIFSKETLDEVREEIPIGRLAHGEDVAYWVKTLLQAESKYCTGQTIYVSGGWLI